MLPHTGNDSSTRYADIAVDRCLNMRYTSVWLIKSHGKNRRQQNRDFLNTDVL